MKPVRVFIVHTDHQEKVGNTETTSDGISGFLNEAFVVRITTVVTWIWVWFSSWVSLRQVPVMSIIYNSLSTHRTEITSDKTQTCQLQVTETRTDSD
jgi:hypothetical protein